MDHRSRFNGHKQRNILYAPRLRFKYNASYSCVATGIDVESTARHAHELGFHVTLAIDAMTDMHQDAHGNSVTRIFPRLGESGTTREIRDLLDRTRA